MSEYQSKAIEQMGKVTNDMAHIIGRYKGAMDAFSIQIKDIASVGEMDAFTKHHLTALVKRMENVVTENEKLWENRGKREATDIVQIERVS